MTSSSHHRAAETISVSFHHVGTVSTSHAPPAASWNVSRKIGTSIASRIDHALITTVVHATDQCPSVHISGPWYWELLGAKLLSREQSHVETAEVGVCPDLV
jgi:hypothetical protein